MSAWREAAIEEIRHATPRIVSVFLRAPIERHVAGQHLDVRLTAEDGYEAQRSYSIASAPGAERIELLVEKLDDGEVSPYFHEIAQAGDTIEVRGPLGGHFIWRPEDGGPTMLLAGGSGIAPLMAIVRAWAASGAAMPLLLVYSARTWDEAAWRDELVQLEQQHANFRFVAAITRGSGQRDQDIEGRVDASSLPRVLEGWPHRPRHVYVCGSNRFVEGATGALLATLPLPPGIVRTERYGGAG